jgi:glycosyltransferase involved in cell wall biosynthesis
MAAGLVELGHEVTVITLDWRGDGDRRGLESIERGVRVVRMDPRRWYPAFDPTEPSLRAEPWPRNLLERKLLSLRAPFSWGPSENWAQQAFRELMVQHRVRPIQVVWAIHGSASCHEAAARFRRATGVPWVADFKDPWEHPLDPRGPALLRGLHWLGTWRRLRTAEGLTETCEAQGQLDARFGKPWRVVWSGYDAALMASASPLRTADHFTLAYFGTINTHHDLGGLARVLGKWKSADSVDAGSTGLHVFCQRSATLEHHLREQGAGDFLRYHDRVPHAEAFGRMRGADLLVLMPMTNMVRSRVLLGVKELEYFAAGTPVLCVGELLPELRSELGELPQLIEAPDDDGLVRLLRREYASYRAGERSSRRVDVNLHSVAAHAWGAQARRLSEVLEGAVFRSGSSATRATNRSLGSSVSSVRLPMRGSANPSSRGNNGPASDPTP